MPTQTLVVGNVDVWKNGTYQSGGPSQLLHDLDLGIFKIVSKGNIIFTFKAQDVTGWNKETRGVLNKKQATKINVKFQNGDEYGFDFQSTDANSFERTRAAIDSVIRQDLAFAEIVRMLKVKDRVTVAEVCQARIEASLASSRVEGSFDGKEFVNKLTLEKESVHYQIVAKFEFQENGAIVFKCPSCGASLPLQGKEPTGNCKYCGGSYTVPRKLLDML